MLRGLAGPAQSYHSLQSQFVPGERLTNEKLASLCGFNIMPLAAHHVVQMATTGNLFQPDTLCQLLHLPANRPGPDKSDLRCFWKDNVLPILLKEYPDRFARRSKSAWQKPGDNSAACRLLGDLIVVAGTSELRKYRLSAKRPAVEHEFSSREVDVLLQMSDMKAFNFNSRKTIDAIVKGAFSGSRVVSPESFKEVIRRLGKKGLVETRPSRGGGCWLTEDGQAAAKELDQ